MLSHLGLTNFGPIAQADFEFCPGVNVLVGENGTGKSLALRAGWLCLEHRTHFQKALEANNKNQALFVFSDFDANARLEFGLNRAAEAIRKNQRASELSLKNQEGASEFSAHVLRDADAMFLPPEDTWVAARPMPAQSCFLPANDPLSQPLGALEALKRHTYRVPPTLWLLARKLSIRRVSPEHLPAPLAALVARVEGAIAGALPSVEADGNYLWENRPIGLMAEGHRKLAAAAMLLANESLQPGDTLFWDEPEANLNPKLLAFLADWLADLAAAGVQVILSTHSLFLMRAFEIARKTKAGLPMRFFALHHGPDGVLCESADELTELQHLSSLDAELAQEDDYLALP